MAVNFKDLIESSDINEEVRESIVEAWESRLAEAREELTAELREEFAQRYEHDKGQIVEAMDRFISEKVEAEIQELVHKPGHHSRDQIDKLMLERWQLRYQLNL